MYSKICMSFDKFGFVYFMIKQSFENETKIVIKRFDNISDAILFYDKNKESIIIPSYNELKKLGVI